MKTYILWIVLIINKLWWEVSCDNEKEQSNNDEHGVSLEGSDFITDPTFIALIDIVFTDGSKRACTGAIVDDTVVITAAHCFTVASDPHAIPELTLSFVVIGTKKMFESGYEQYLPIERVLTHPDYHGWKADLSLVFTFAAMIADKPGSIVRLAGDSIIDRDTKFTVISWGSTNEQPSTKSIWKKKTTKKTTTKKKKDSCGSDSDDWEDNNENIERQGNENRLVDRNKDRYKGDDDTMDSRDLNQDRDRDHDREKYRKPDQEKKNNFYRYENDDYVTPLPNYKTSFQRVSRTTAFSHDDGSRQDSMMSKYRERSRLENLPPRSDSSFSPNSDSTEQMTSTSTTTEHIHKLRFDELPHMNEENLDKYIDAINEKVRSKQSAHNLDFKKHSIRKRSLDSSIEKSMETENSKLKSFYKNWRRSMGNQHNQVFVGEFSMIKLSECKRLMERAVSSVYDISDGNDFVCYTSDDRLISDHDSGAPAIKRHRLVAITLGAFECDSERVALGMKMSCYCSWIASNIPNGKNFTCCTDCCTEKPQHARW